MVQLSQVDVGTSRRSFFVSVGYGSAWPKPGELCMTPSMDTIGLMVVGAFLCFLGVEDTRG